MTPAPAAISVAAASGGPADARADLRTRAGAAALAGCLLFFALPMFPLAVLGYVWLVPMLWAGTTARTDPGAFLLGLLTGIVFSSLGFRWLLLPLRTYLELPAASALLLFVALCAWQAIFFALVNLLVRLVRRNTGLPFAMVVPIAVVAMEFCVPFLVPWTLAITQAWFLPIIQIAELTGSLGVTFCLAMVNGALYDALVARLRRDPLPRRPLLIAGTLLTTVLGFGLLRMHQMDGQWRAAPKLKVGVVQPNIRADLKPQIDRSDRFKGAAAEELRDAGMRKHLYATAKLRGQGAQLVVWSESSYPNIVPHAEPTGGGADAAFPMQLRVPILLGAISQTESGKLFNSALLLDRHSKVSGRYDKRALFLLAERVPLIDRFPSLRRYLPSRLGGYEPGRDATTLSLADSRVGGGTFLLGPLICMDDLLSGQVTELGRRHPHVLAYLGNDGWFDAKSEPWEHLALSVFRSIEQRTAMVRAAQTGVSGFIDATGRVRAWLSPTDPTDAEMASVGTLLGEVAMLEAGHTAYATVGSLWGRCDLLGLLALAALVFLLGRPKQATFYLRTFFRSQKGVVKQ